MINLFLSYSHANTRRAKELRDRLAAGGAQCWLDSGSLRAGQDFPLEITRAIRASDALVLLLSKESNASDFVHREVALAHHFGKPVLPVRLDQAEVSDELLPYIVRSHYVQFDRASVSELGSCLSECRIALHTEEAKPPGPESETGTWVTWAEFEPFTRMGRLASIRLGKPSERVVGVSWEEALAFCDWAGKQLPVSRSPDGSCGDPPLPDLDMLLEWRDGGNDSHKHIVDSATLNVVGVMRRNVRGTAVGFRSADIGSPPQREWVRVSGYACRLGTDAPAFSKLADEFGLPEHISSPVKRRTIRQIDVPDVDMASTCVTNEEYFAFTKTGQPYPIHWNAKWLRSQGFPFPARLRHRPVTNVALKHAKAYCAWAGVGLPTSWEWQCAVTGGEGRRYPWGDEYNERVCNSQESGRGSLARVDDYGQGDTPSGLRQLCGNVFEWTTGPDGVGELVGGSYRSPCQLWGLGCMFSQPVPGYLAPDVGFRVVRRL